MPELRVDSTEATLGAIVAGVELAALDSSSWRAVEAAFHEHALLIFPAQHLSDAQQVAFARRFGEIEHIVGELDVIPISNQRHDGRLLADEEPAMQIMRGNEGWHTDSSYMPLAAKASVLSAHVVPAEGGRTGWADMRAAYQALDDATRQRVGELSAYHSIRYSQERIGDSGPGIGYGYFDGEPPLRPLVKRHPVTGRPSLFIGRHAFGIPGLEPTESEELLDALLQAACEPPRTYEHSWQPGDIAIWDNRCVLHRARPFDHSVPRVMKHTRVAGDPATELAGS